MHDAPSEGLRCLSPSRHFKASQLLRAHTRMRTCHAQTHVHTHAHTHKCVRMRFAKVLLSFLIACAVLTLKRVYGGQFDDDQPWVLQLMVLLQEGRLWRQPGSRQQPASFSTRRTDRRDASTTSGGTPALTRSPTFSAASPSFSQRSPEPPFMFSRTLSSGRSSPQWWKPGWRLPIGQRAQQTRAASDMTDQSWRLARRPGALPGGPLAGRITRSGERRSLSDRPREARAERTPTHQVQPPDGQSRVVVQSGTGCNDRCTGSTDLL